jgi:hypothetical protein
VGEVLAEGNIQLGIANCSEDLGQLAATRCGILFDTIITGEQAGFYSRTRARTACRLSISALSHRIVCWSPGGPTMVALHLLESER